MSIHFPFAEYVEGLKEMSLNPPQMKDSIGRRLPAGFVPFCAYKDNALGVESSDLPFIPCSQALPTVLDGQLCYSINGSIHATESSKRGKNNGLVMLLDFGKNQNEGESVEVWEKGKPVKTSQKYKGLRVYVQTLSGFSSNGEGDYAMSSLKRMRGKKSFLDFPNAIKKCQVEPRDKCRVLKYFETVQGQCGCVPWGLMDFSYVNPEVRQASKKNWCSMHSVIPGM